MPLPLGREGHVVAALLNERKGSEPPATTLVANLLTATHSRVEEVRIEPLKKEILHGVVRLSHEGRGHEIAARPGEAIALAVQMNAPIFVAEEIMAAASWELSDALPLVQQIRHAGDEASLRRAAAEPLVARVAQAFLERGLRQIRDEDGYRAAEVELQPREMASPGHIWKHVWFTCRYGQGSTSGGNVSLPLDALPALIARFKLMANLDLADRQTPQQGRTTVQHKGQGYALTVSTEPTELGEKVTLGLELSA